MRYFIYTAIIMVFFTSCNKTIDTPLTDSSILLYNKELVSLPIVKDNAFYFVTQENDSLKFSCVTSKGDFSTILDLTGYLPTGYTYDSLVNLKTSLTTDEGFALAFSYKDTSQGGRTTKFTLIKLNARNTVAWNITDTIPNSTMQSELQAIGENTDGNIEVISAGNSMSQQNSNTDLIQNTYSGTSGTFISSNESSLDGKSLSGVFPITDGFLIVATAVNMDTSSGNPGGNQMNSNNCYLMKMDAAGNMVSEQIDIGISAILAVAGSNSQFIISATSGDQFQGSSPVVISADLTQGLMWEDSLISSSDLYITNIAKADSGYYLTGAKFTEGSFRWNSESSLENSQMYISKIDGSGNTIWENILSGESSIGTGVIENADGTISWLATKRLFSSLNNIALLKTNSTGTIQ